MEDKNSKNLKGYAIRMEKNQKFKQCTKCKIYYPSSSEFFYKKRTMKDGLDSWCKECKQEYDKQLYQYKRYKLQKKNMRIIWKIRKVNV